MTSSSTTLTNLQEIQVASCILKTEKRSKKPNWLFWPAEVNGYPPSKCLPKVAVIA